MREFDTGATRDTDEGKNDYEAFLSPLVIEAFGDYMHKNRIQADGNMRSGDNWQKGMPNSAYMKSGWRHFMAWWRLHRDWAEPDEDYDDGLEEAICALMFNCMGYLHNLKEKQVADRYTEAREEPQ